MSKSKTRSPAPMTRQEALVKRTEVLGDAGNVLSGARVYLSGPMDFVASRAEEKQKGWRNRIGQFLSRMGTLVYDPWNKPAVVGMPHYGKEDEFSTEKRYNWTYDDSPKGDRIRAELCEEFWPTMHIDLRMVDTADFLVAYCPTNVYSVGTVHEIVMASLQHKPVLFVSPPIAFPSLDQLRRHLETKDDREALRLLEELEVEAPLRQNEAAVPSMWYMALLDAHYFFDGFGFAHYMKQFNWKRGELDEREEQFRPRRPLLPYLEALNSKIPPKYDLERDQYVENADWLVFDVPETQ